MSVEFIATYHKLMFMIIYNNPRMCININIMKLITYNYDTNVTPYNVVAICM